MEGEGIFEFNVKRYPGTCPVKYCTRKSRTGGRGTHVLCGKHHSHLWRLKNPDRAAFHNLKASAKRKKISFLITFDQFLEIAKATGYVDGKGRTRMEYHMDREDHRLGYEISNVRVITCTENASKGAREKYVPYLVQKKLDEEAALAFNEAPYNEFTDPTLDDEEDPF